MKKYHDLSDEEIKSDVRDILNRCENSSTDKAANKEIKRLIKEELSYNGTPAITSTSTSRGGMTMRMFMVMMSGPRGNIIST